MGKKEAEIFQDQIAFLVKREKYTLSDFYDGLKEGIDKAGISTSGVRMSCVCAAIVF